MGHFITLTPQPITIHTSKKDSHFSQPLWTVIDISGYDILDLKLGVLFLSEGVTATAFIDTSMQNMTESTPSEQMDGEWMIASQFPHKVEGKSNTIPQPQWQKVNISSGPQTLLKFVRWRVHLSDPGTATFFIRGIARRYGR